MLGQKQLTKQVSFLLKIKEHTKVANAHFFTIQHILTQILQI